MATDLFIDGFGRIAFREGVVRMELVSLSQEQPVVVHTLVMTLPAFLRSLQLQQDIVKKFQDANMIRPAAPPSGAMAPPPEPAMSSPDEELPTAEAQQAPSSPPGPIPVPKSPNFEEE